MASAAVVVERQPAGRGVGAQHGKARGADLAHLRIGGQVFQEGHHRADTALVEVAHGVAVADGERHQLGAGHFGAQGAQQARQHRDLQVVGQADAEHRRGARRFEVGLRAERGLDLRERGAQALHQGERPCGGFHHAALAHQQRIAREFAQSRERMAHRGLAEVQPLGGAADVALAHERGQHGEQVQVDAVEFDGFHRGRGVIDGAHSDYPANRFP
ncbi:hypothetical protein D9M68_676490 [compost metagenome]